MEPLLLKGWTLEVVTVNKGLIRWTRRERDPDYNAAESKDSVRCSNLRDCDNEIRMGAQVFLLRDKKNKIRALFCSVECERKRFVDFRVESERRKKRAGRAGR